ncbi:hypothetical protein [Sphingobacterium sp.]|uniref:hypothetical protein n=1 Tax=Sphingobacterium sp. TaxID=341027 RepID=UPI0031E38BE8
MNTISKQQEKSPEITSEKLFLGTDRWYRILKSISVLYRWELIHSKDNLIRLLQMQQSWLAQQHYRTDDTLLDQLTSSLPLLDRQPRIWSCMHIGPYGMVARALMALGRKLAILLREDIFEEQGQIYRQQYKLSFGREATAAELLFIKADRGNPLLKLGEALRRGYDVIIFIDGQLRIGDLSRGWARIKLHDTDLLLREGVTALAHWTGMPIRPLIVTTIAGQIKLRITEDFCVKSKADYSVAMQYIIELLRDLDVEELLQWECLPTIFDGQADPAKMKLRNAIWLPFLAGDAGMLFDITTGISVGIGAKEFEIACQKFKEIGAIT